MKDRNEKNLYYILVTLFFLNLFFRWKLLREEGKGRFITTFFQKARIGGRLTNGGTFITHSKGLRKLY